MKVPLIATKSLKYNTRRLMAGDEFEARNEMDARILTRIRKVAEEPKAKPVKAEAPAGFLSGAALERGGAIKDVVDMVGEERASQPTKPAAKKAAPKAGTKARAKKAAAKK